MIPDRTGAEVNDPRPVNLKTFAVFGEVCLATGTVVHEVPTSPTLGSGAGVPTHTRPDGSLFLRTDGVAGSTLYTMIAGVWTPVDSGGTAETAKALDDLLGHTLTAEDGELNTAARHDQNTDQFIDQGGANETTAAEIRDAADKRHDQNTDTFLDQGGPNQSTAADVKDAVDKAHTQGTDQFLDQGGVNQSTAADVKDAVDKKHDQNTDQFLDEGGPNQSTAADVADAVSLRHTQGTDQGLDTGGPNATTAADVKDAVDKAHTQGTDQFLDQGGVNQSTAADVKDAVDKKHDQDTDQFLDFGGANQVSAADVASAVGDSHVQGTDQFLDQGGVNQSTAADVKDAVDKAHVQGTDQGLDTGGPNASTAADVADAVSLKHDQNTDTFLDQGGANQVTAADAADAVSKKHTQGTDQFLDQGGVNQVTAADAASAVSLKHSRSHALDDASDHTIGAGVLGQVIGVVAGPALGWITPVGAATLQSAYDGGNTIVTAGSKDIDFTLTSGDFLVDGGSSLFGSVTPQTAFDVDAVAMSLDATAASNLSVTGGDLTLSTLTSGNLDLTAADDINLSAPGSDIDMDAATLTADMTGAISIDGVGNSNLTIDSGNLTLETTTSGTLSVDSAGALDLTSGAASTWGFTGGVDVTGTVEFQDNAILAVGAGDDFHIIHDATDTTLTSKTGDLVVDNTNTTGTTVAKLGTDTSATAFEVQNDSGTSLFKVAGDGTITPVGAGGGGILATYDFPSTGTKDWATDGAGTEGLWTCSVSPTDFDTCEFSGGVLDVALNNSSGSTKIVKFVLDLSAYANMALSTVMLVGMNLELTTLSGNGALVFTQVATLGSADYLRAAITQTVAGNPDMSVSSSGSNVSTSATVSCPWMATSTASRIIAAYSSGASVASVVFHQGAAVDKAGTGQTAWPKINTGDLYLFVQVNVPNGTNIDVQISDVFCGPLLVEN